MTIKLDYKKRPKGMSKREYWASKTGYNKKQYKDREKLPDIKKTSGSLSSPRVSGVVKEKELELEKVQETLTQYERLRNNPLYKLWEQTGKEKKLLDAQKSLEAEIKKYEEATTLEPEPGIIERYKHPVESVKRGYRNVGKIAAMETGQMPGLPALVNENPIYSALRQQSEAEMAYKREIAGRLGNMIADTSKRAYGSGKEGVKGYIEGQKKKSAGRKLLDASMIGPKMTYNALKFLFSGTHDFTKTAGKVFGEGAAYALDPTVREQYLKGNTDILPTVSSVSPRQMLGKTGLAGLEAITFGKTPSMFGKSAARRVAFGTGVGYGYDVLGRLAREDKVNLKPGLGTAIGFAASFTPEIIRAAKAKSVNPIEVAQKIDDDIYGSTVGRKKQYGGDPIDSSGYISEKQKEHIIDDMSRKMKRYGMNDARERLNATMGNKAYRSLDDMYDDAQRAFFPNITPESELAKMSATQKRVQETSAGSKLPKAQLKDEQTRRLETVLTGAHNQYTKLDEGVRLTFQEADDMANTALYKSEMGVDELKDAVGTWAGRNNAARTQAYLNAKFLKDVPRDEFLDFMRYMEGGNVKISPKSMAIAEKLKKDTDIMHKMATDLGMDIGYVENYFTHVWDLSDEELNKLALRGSLGQKSKYALRRKVPTIEEGLKMGLKLKYDNPAQAYGAYLENMYRTFNNIKLYSELVDNGFLVPASVGRKAGFVPVKAKGVPLNSTIIGDGKKIVGEWYADPDVAKLLNNAFGYDDLHWGLRMAKNASRRFQDLGISGGVPGTGVNAFGMAQSQKIAMAGHPEIAAKAIYTSVSDDIARDLFERNADDILDMQLRGYSGQTNLNVRDMWGDLRSYDSKFFKNLANDFDDRGYPTLSKIFKKIKPGASFDKLMNKPTFQRLMPTIDLELFKDVKYGLIKKGMDANTSADIAMKAVNNYQGYVSAGERVLGNKTTEALKSTFFFAPQYRAAMIRFWLNNAKAISPVAIRDGALRGNNPFSAENKHNTTFIASSIALYMAYDKMNQYLNNGKHLWDNPKGKEDKLLIPTQDGGHYGVPFLSSIATMPRLGYRVGQRLAAGETAEAGRELSSTLPSMILKPVFDAIITNENYFGQKIAEEDMTPSEKWEAKVKYMLSQYAGHPYIKAALNAKGKPKLAILFEATEMPFRYYKPGSVSAGYFYQNRDESIEGLSEEEIKAFDALHMGKNLDEDGLPVREGNKGMADAQLRLAFPNVRAAETQAAIATALDTGEEISPYYKLTDAQQQVVLLHKTMPPGSGERKLIREENPWLEQYWEETNKFFDKLVSEGKMKPSDSNYVEPDAHLQELLSQFDKLTTGTGEKTRFLREHPEVKNFFDESRKRTNAARKELGYSELEDEYADKEDSYLQEDFDNIQALLKEGNESEADKMVSKMTNTDYTEYKKLRNTYRSQNKKILVTKLEGQNPQDAVVFLRSLPKREQDRLLPLMSDTQYALYEQAKQRL